MKENVQVVTFNTILFRVLTDPFVSRLYSYDQKTHLSIRIHIVKMKKAEGRSEYIDLAKEANLLWHQIVSQKSKDTPRIDCRT